MAVNKEAMYYKKAETDGIQCLLCPHRCIIAPGMAGICGVRKNEDEKLIAMNYGMVSSLALDPIEKKPLMKFYPGSSILSAGTIGCNLACPFCQNYTIARARPGEMQTDCILPDEMVSYAESLRPKGNIGIAYTYNEPFVWYEYVLETAKLAREKSLKNVLVTNGYVCSEPLLELLPFVDAMNIDLKAFNAAFYKDIVRGGLSEVKETIAAAVRQCHVEITTLIVPELNDSVEETGKMARWIASLSPDIPLHLTRFFPRYRMMDREPTPIWKLDELANAAREFLNCVYIGNV